MSRQESISFDLRITRADYLSYYKGTANWVQVRARDGRRIRFPASALRPFVTEDGIQGAFEITYEENHRLVGIHRLDT
jgi:hypothetical protein